MNIKKYSNYFFARINMGLKENTEYKVNVYSSILTDVTVILGNVLFFLVYSKVLDNKLLNWTSYDFFTYTILTYFSFKVMRLFQFHRLKNLILNGNFNTILTKPLNPYFFLLFKSLRGFRLITTPIAFIFLIIVVLFGNYTNLVLSFIIFFFGCIYLILIYNTLHGLAFFIKENFFIQNIYDNIQGIIKNFTPKIFETGIFYYFVMLFPMSVSGYITLEILRNKFFVLNYLLAPIIIFICLIIINIFMWHYGLKKYEAFG